MAYLQLYRDRNCTDLFMSIPVVAITGNPSKAPSILTYKGTEYKYFDWENSVLIHDVPIIKSNPPLVTSRNRVTTQTTMYFKNGVSVHVLESTEQGRFEHFLFGQNDLSPSNNSGASAENPAKLFAISFIYEGAKYIGFTGWIQGNQSSYFRPICCVESRFWTDAIKPAYDYGSKPDDDGGQGTGKIDDASITKGQQTGSMPTGGRGLHWYRMPDAGYNSVQDYLWGDVSGTTAVTTIVKSLWQKFQNKTHGPSQCIVGAYKLPSLFMPERGGASGVQLAGINLPTSNTFVTSPGFVYKRINLGTQTPPFGSWLDYQGVTCKIGVPFCGEIACPVEAIWNKEVMIRYCCDQHNGNIVATVWSGDHVLGEMSGNCAYQVPVVGGDDGTLARLGALVGTAASAVAAIATDGASLAVGGVVAGAASAAGAQHHTYVTNGNLSGGVSACINGVAYIDFIYPSTAYPAEKSYADGYGFVASAAHGTIGGFKGGYGEFTVLKRDGGMMIPRATDAEKDEIIRLLETGVIV